MNAHDKVPNIKGHWKLDVYKGDIHTPEYLERTFEGDNIVVTLGKDILLDLLFGIGTSTKLTHMGVGTDSTAAAVGQTKLNPSVAGSVSFLAFDSTPTRASEVVTCVRTWDTATGNFQWNELGLANSATNDGTHLFNRIVIGPFTKTSAVSIVVTVTITQS